ncbi:MAG: (Fe-S)-binding protein [Acidobacteria bacterium]|jgi:Fe-S oxidoreductase|nr:(Fe-S)-binding protein [Bryobacteraceae bacterium CoA2 C42]
MAPLSAVESAMFLVLLALALFGFARRFSTVVKLLSAAKPDADFQLAPVGRRVWDFFWEVLCQAKVIQERPLPGLLHAFVFWGFCAFGLITLNHFAIGVGLPLFSIHGNPLGWLAAAFAVVTAVSIAGLAIRRLVWRPEWLGEVSWESGFIALLIFVLMVTYLADFAWSPTGPLYQGLWWVHTLALLIFLPLIPHTKHLHLVLSPATVFLSRGSFSAIPPLAGDEDFGLVSGKDVTKLTVLQAFSCVECGRCTEHCPAANTGKLLNPKQIILGARDYLNEFGVASEEPLLGLHISQEAAFQCTTCGACEYQCPVGIEHLPVIIGLRRGAVNTGAWEDEHGTKLFLNLERYGNPMGFPALQRDRFVKAEGLPLYDGTQEYLLWMGCMGSYDPAGREIVSSLVQVLRHHNISFGVLKKERCSGDSARRLGNDLVFQTLANQNIEAIEAVGAKKMLSICPHCVRTLGQDYREFGVNLEIEHHSALLARYATPAPPEQTVVYHDPCYLGRYQDIYEEPRAVAASAGALVEAPRSRERGFCCGAGGGLAFLGEEPGSRVNHARAEELAGTGADIVAAACPFCNTMFRDGLAAVSDRPPQLLDIAQIAARNLPQ